VERGRSLWAPVFLLSAGVLHHPDRAQVCAAVGCQSRVDLQRIDGAVLVPMCPYFGPARGSGAAAGWTAGRVYGRTTVHAGGCRTAQCRILRRDVSSRIRSVQAGHAGRGELGVHAALPTCGALGAGPPVGTVAVCPRRGMPSPRSGRTQSVAALDLAVPVDACTQVSQYV